MRTKISNKKRDGFAGELLISIPQNVLAGAIQKGQILPHQLYVSHIGYFPKALYHYCQRPQGCVDNILFYCVQGKGYYTLDGHTFTLNPNQYVIVPATDKPLVYWSDTEDPWSSTGYILQVTPSKHSTGLTTSFGTRSAIHSS